MLINKNKFVIFAEKRLSILKSNYYE